MQMYDDDITRRWLENKSDLLRALFINNPLFFKRCLVAVTLAHSSVFGCPLRWGPVIWKLAEEGRLLLPGCPASEAPGMADEQAGVGFVLATGEMALYASSNLRSFS